jgi:AcrR family transcriptional regulator
MDAETRILEAAVELLANAGYDGLTISAVARASGVSRPTVYAHFGTRERLVSEALTLVATDIAARVMRRTGSASSGAEFLVESVVAVCREFRRQPALAPLAFPQRGTTIVDDASVPDQAPRLRIHFGERGGGRAVSDPRPASGGLRVARPFR